MGYPIIVTPVSQLVATQAVRNILDGERWATVSDETCATSSATTGSPQRPWIEVADRVLSRPLAEELRHLQPLSLEGAQARFGRKISDEELLLQRAMPDEQVDAMLARLHRSRAAGARGRPAKPSSGRDPAARGRANVGQASARAGGRRGRGVAPCDLTTSRASSSTSTARSCTGRARRSISSPAPSTS